MSHYITVPLLKLCNRLVNIFRTVCPQLLTFLFPLICRERDGRVRSDSRLSVHLVEGARYLTFKEGYFHKNTVSLKAVSFLGGKSCEAY